jgi:ribonuclease E
MVEKEENGKRSRLFGIRKGRKSVTSDSPASSIDSSVSPTQDEVAMPPAPVGVPSVDDATETGRRATGNETLSSVAGLDHVEKLPEPIVGSGRVGPRMSDAAEPEDTEDVRRPTSPGLPATSILFQAPDIPPLPPLPQGGRMDDGDEAPNVRRRARRRSGEEARPGTDDPANTVVKVRTPKEPELITEPQRIKGSTRLEAKKQRRRDGRDAGRRRPVITEAEFLARREAVDRQMVVRSRDGRIQIGVLEDKVLVEHYVAKSQEASLIGNVYLGRVQNVLPSMEAAFVDIGRGRNAVLYSGEVDWEAAETGNQARRIELALKPGDKVLVQVTKDPVGHKGARLTSQVSLPGRYLVYVPNGSMNGISRKLPDTERSRLKKILKEVLPDNVGVIVRTAAEGATEEQLTVDVSRLRAQWEAISKQVETVQAPALLHSEPDLLIKIVRDVFNEDFQKMIIAGQDAKATIETYLSQVAPDLLDRVEEYSGSRDAFDEFRITEQIEKALDRKVWLPSGGSLVIDRTEAMTVVDVNTGKFVGSGGNLEETVTKNNLEAAEEIVRQLRLRDIGGIIVVDFIDMVLESNRDLVLRRLVECLSRDRTKHQVAEVTSLGLIQMTRKKLGLGLLETFSEPCEVCAGRGVIVHHDPVVKHRSAPQPVADRRRGRGGQQNGEASKQALSNAATHAITDDAKNALAQIAASTLAHTGHHDGSTESTSAAGLDPNRSDQNTAAAIEGQASSEAAANASDGNRSDDTRGGAPQGERSKRSRSSRGGQGSRRNRRSEDERSSAGSSEGTPGLESVDSSGQTETSRDTLGDESSTSVQPLLDLPVPVVTVAERAKAADAGQLLESVLDALPEPKKPGQGRSRNRRVTTASLAGTAVLPEPTPERADVARVNEAGDVEPLSR